MEECGWTALRNEEAVNVPGHQKKHSLRCLDLRHAERFVWIDTNFVSKSCKKGSILGRKFAMLL